ncbi:MAG: hypothetical protein Q9170_004479 [Blastenia crenularia]
MVVFLPPCVPEIVNAYSTIPLLPEVHTSVLHDFNIGSFARFLRPEHVLSIQERLDFHGLSQLDIRIRLDDENKKGPFVIIDETTAKSHAVWYVVSTEECKVMTEYYPPVTYPQEEFPLWHLHIFTQTLPYEYGELNGGDISIADLVQEPGTPYDPHDPQEPPHGSQDWDKKGEWEHQLPEPLVIASPGEWEWSDDPKLRREVNPYQFEPDPPAVVQLTDSAAKEAGLLAAWHGYFKGKPQAGQPVEMRQKFDWDSPKWPWDGVVSGNTMKVTTARRPGRIIQTSCRTTRRAPSILRTKGYGPERQKSSNVTAAR